MARQQDKLLSDSITLLKNNPDLLDYLLSLPRRFSLDELKEKLEHKCEMPANDFLLSPDELDIPREDLDDILKNLDTGISEEYNVM